MRKPPFPDRYAGALAPLRRGSFCLFILIGLGSFSSKATLRPDPATFHPFHTSLTQMQFDPQRQTFEVSVRIFTDDFETALTKESGGKSVHLGNEQKQDKLIEQYVHRHFVVANADRKVNPITYVGYEQEADAQWVYLEMPYANDKQTIVMKQDILMDLFADQVNLVTIQLNQVKKTVVFRNNQPVQAVSL